MWICKTRDGNVFGTFAEPILNSDGHFHVENKHKMIHLSIPKEVEQYAHDFMNELFKNVPPEGKLKIESFGNSKCSICETIF